MQPKIYVSQSEDASQSLTALFYLDAQRDLYGWHLQSVDGQVSAAYFMIEHFYADRLPVLYRSIADDVYEPWVTDYPPRRELLRCPLPDAVAHELEHLQSAFVDDWLFFENDIGIAAEVESYRNRGMELQPVNIRSRKLARMTRERGHWYHMTPGTDFNVAYFLEKHWRSGVKLALRPRGDRWRQAAPRH